MSLCAALLVFQTLHLCHLPVNYYLVAFVFFSTLASYNFHYILAGAISRQALSLSLFSSRYVSTIFLCAGCAGVVLLFPPSGISLLNAGIAVMLTGVYSIPLLPYKSLDVARKAGFLKTILLAFTWMFVTAYIPMEESSMQFSTLGVLIMAKRFLFMLMLCIIFDNRDINVDKINGLHSLATDLSPRLMQWLIFIVFSLLFTLNFFFGKHGVSSRQVTAVQLSSLATLVVYFLSRKKQGYFFYYFIVDGMMILMVLLTTIASI